MAKLLTNHRITTYAEIEKSYPHKKKGTTWKEHFEQTKGALHQVHFYRIVFDEIHTIKNHHTRTFRAATSLMGTRRWGLTGTPVTDKTEEIFAYNRVLRIPNTGKIDTFQTNYCNPNNSKHPLRLTELIRPHVFRRTKNDKFLGSSILDLPKTNTYTLYCRATKFERAVQVALVEHYKKLSNTSNTSLQNSSLAFQ